MYKEILPNEKLARLIHSFWTHRNDSDTPRKLTIVPDGYSKIIFVVQHEKIIRYFMTGIWAKEKEVILPSDSIYYGCRLKILAPEFLLGHEIATLQQGVKQLDTSYLELKHFDLSSFEGIVHQWQLSLLTLKSPKEIPGNKLRLSQLLDSTKGEPTAKAVAEQIFWTNRQINRYMNKYVGLSLKRYLNIQKVYQSYIQIREGRFFPEKDYFDRAHFIKEVKKHTGETPTSLHENQNDRFIQIKNIKPR